MFVSLEDNSTVVYLCSAPYAPGREFGVNPECETVGIEFPSTARDGSPLELLLSEKDASAPGLITAADLGHLPTWSEYHAFMSSR